MAAKLLKQVPATDRMWLMAQLRDSLENGPALMPLESGESKKIRHLPSGAELVAEMPQETALIINTSGSTGKPKFVALAADAIKASAQATNDYLGGAGQWVVALPIHLISGLQILTRSILSETTPVFYDGKFDPADFIKTAEKLEAERKYTSLVPVQLARLLEYAEDKPKALQTLRKFNKILIGGQSTSTALRQKAYEMEINIARTYGMTETAGGVVYDGVEIGDTRVRVRDGEVQLAGSTLALGYIGEPELSSQKFITDTDTTLFKTGDTGKLLGGMLNITGRIDRVIISGGVNVSLDEVESVLAAFNGYETAVAIAVKDETWGHTISVARETGVGEVAVGETAVKQAIEQKLGVAAVPKSFFEFKEIPRLANGKPDLTTIKSVVEARKSETK